MQEIMDHVVRLLRNGNEKMSSSVRNNSGSPTRLSPFTPCGRLFLLRSDTRCVDLSELMHCARGLAYFSLWSEFDPVLHPHESNCHQTSHIGCHTLTQSTTVGYGLQSSLPSRASLQARNWWNTMFLFECKLKKPPRNCSKLLFLGFCDHNFAFRLIKSVKPSWTRICGTSTWTESKSCFQERHRDFYEAALPMVDNHSLFNTTEAKPTQK